MKLATEMELHTLPHEDFGALGSSTLGAASPANSSARPQEQSLQAFLFPVVPQTV